MTTTATDKLADGELVTLPPEAGDDTAARFDPNDDWLERADAVAQKTAMWRWLATHFEDPRLVVPRDDHGGFLYGDGEPHHADRELHERFDGVVAAGVIDELAASVRQTVGNDWVVKPLDKAGS